MIPPLKASDSVCVSEKPTEGELGDHPVRLNGVGDSEAVLSADAERVLLSWDKLAQPAACLPARGQGRDPVSPADVTLLHHVVGDVAAAVLQGFVPGEGAGV